MDTLVKELELKMDYGSMDKATPENNNSRDSNNGIDDNDTWATVVARRRKTKSDTSREGSGEMQQTKGKANAEHLENSQQTSHRNEMINKLKSQARFQRQYKKETTLTMTVKGPENITVTMIIKAVEDKTGIGKLFGLRKKSNFDYELTMENETDCDHLMDGLMINQQFCEVSKLCATERMVSFLNLPNYIQDSEIIQKLVDWGVSPILPLRRRYYPGTTVADGTRFIRVKFPKEVMSLPYNVKFDTEEGPKYFRVIHDQQIKTCRLCGSAEHEKKDCPQFVCRECLEQGHFARDCKAPRCQGCKKTILWCRCESDEEETGVMETNKQMEKSSNEEQEEEVQELPPDDLNEQEEEQAMSEEDEGDTAETEAQDLMKDDGHDMEEEQGAAGENTESRIEEEVSDDDDNEEINIGTKDRTIDSINRRRRKTVQLNIQQVLKKQKLRKEAKAKLKTDRTDLRF